MLEARAQRVIVTRVLSWAELRLVALLLVTVGSLIALSTQLHPPPWLHAALFGHLMALLLGFGSVLSVDWFGFLWLLRRVPMAACASYSSCPGRCCCAAGCWRPRPSRCGGRPA